MNTTWTISELFAHLRSLDVRLALDGARLAVSAPRGALNDDIKRELQSRKPEIMDFLRSAVADGGRDEMPIPRLESHSSVPLSSSQQRLWFLDRMDPGNPMYNIAGAARLTGTLDHEALERSLRAILDRHESLRTVFREADGVPMAVVTPADGWSISVASLLSRPQHEREAEMQRLAVVEARRSFDLARDAMLRATLIVVGPTEHVLLVVMHHIAADGWSLGVFIKELDHFYRAFHAREEPALPPLPIQYGDYAVWHQRWMESGILDAQLPHWKRSLVAPLSTLELPLDNTRPPLQTSRGRRVSFTIPAALTEALKRYSLRENGTLFMTLLTGFNILLSRYSGEEDVIIGTAVANRTRPELTDLIGVFVNNLVLRTDLSGSPTVREALNRTSRVALDGFANQEVPFDRLVETLRPERTLDRSPLFQTMFILQNWPLRDLELPGLLLSPMELDIGLARYDLTVEAIEKSGTLQFHYEYNTDLLDAATVERMHSHFATLLAAMIEHPERRITELPMLTSGESALILGSWNDTAASYPSTLCVHQLIEQQALRTPDAEAVRSGDVSLTYSELMRRSNRLANRLRAMGVGSESLVGICVDRTHEMVVALLGVWKAGGAYVPLDPSYPYERIAFMMEDAGLAALVTEASLSSDLPVAQCPVLYLDRDSAQIAEESDVAPDKVSGAQNLAYVIYTSGSTGKPKGVLIEHRSVVNFLCSMQREPGLTSTDSLLSVTTLSFDIAGLEIFLPLVTGARVILVSRATAADGMLLARTIVDSGATVMQATPATWRLLLDAGWREAHGLTVLSGGEALSRQLADAILDTGADLWNLYGPTETTVWSTLHHVRRDGGIIPLGRPISNTSVYVLDEDRRPVPVKVAGELYIGGVGLARGYHHRSELTAERFVADPFASEPGARMYRTGDRARFRADGTVEYLGRLDNQVKVRGFRIELGEIESVLSANEQVQHAVVLVREDVPGDQRLVAYVTATPTERLTTGTLRSWVAERLPQHMVPSAFVNLDAFPLTPNGKVDRRALAAQQTPVTEPSHSFISPHTEVERSVAEIWRAVLRVEQIGAADNFFDLGGHSLLVVQMQSQLRERFKCELSLMELFRRPTVGAIAAYLTANGADTPTNIDSRAAVGAYGVSTR